jgi:VanZ family protein
MTIRLGFRIGLWCCVLAVAWLAFAPLQAPVGFSYDKSNHLLAFFVMATLADGGWPGRRHAPARIALLLGYGLLIELIQRELPYREFSLFDLAADALGILLYQVGKAAATRLRLRLRATP